MLLVSERKRPCTQSVREITCAPGTAGGSLPPASAAAAPAAAASSAPSAAMRGTHRPDAPTARRTADAGCPAQAHWPLPSARAKQATGAQSIRQLATPLPRAIRSSATRRVGGAHAPAAQACYGIGRQGCNTLVYVRARLKGDPTLRLLRLGRPRHHRREHVRVVRSPRRTHSCGNAHNKTYTKG